MVAVADSNKMEVDQVDTDKENKNDLLKHSNPKEVTDLSLDGKGPLKLTALTSLQDYVNLVNLSLKNVGLKSLKGLVKLPNLKKLDLSSNQLTNTLFFLSACPQLTELILSNNNIKEVFALKPLGKLKYLQSLKLDNCEVTKVNEYRRKAFHIMKALKTLDGEDKTAEDAEPPQPEEPKIKSEDAANDTKKGKKRKSKEGEISPKKQKLENHSKNPLMQLNELKPGLKYVVESVSGPAHSPHFVVSVEVNDSKYVGRGNSKQLAKHAAAQAALSSFVQFRDTPLVMSAMRPLGMIDFTCDVKNEEFGDRFEYSKNGSNLGKKMDISSDAPAKGMKILIEADKKNPVMLLNEMRPGLEYTTEAENSSAPSQRFRVSVTVDDIKYEGTGPNKKLAKVAAARSVLSNLYNVCYNSYVSTDVNPDSPNADLFTFPRAVADKISSVLMNTYNEVMVGNTENAKWKVIAGIAMTRDEAMKDIQIVSIGTGTKCINGEHISMVGASLNDCHAEIISRRCLKDFLYTNLELHLEGEEDQSIFEKKPSGGFALKPDIKFHLYISTAPCGDARIFCPNEELLMLETMDRHPNRNSRGVLRTKIESGEGTIPIRPEQKIQTWDGILPGQERLLTMSCSDKVSSWNVLGMQGALLSYFVDPIYLDSIILGGLFHPNHLPRAMFGRYERSLPPLPPKYRLNKPKMCTISSPETRHLSKSPNLSVNWTHGLGRAEIVNATTGKTEKGQVSRLSKRAFFQRFMNIYDRLPHIAAYESPQPPLYAAYKGVVKDYQLAKRALTTAFKDAGLGTWVKKPVEQNEFELVF